MKVHDRYCCLLIVHGVIMTNEGQLRLHEDEMEMQSHSFRFATRIVNYLRHRGLYSESHINP